MSKNPPRAAFLFTNSKDEVIADVRAGRGADTALHGMNHFSEADYFTVFPQSMRAAALIPRLLRYDFIIAQDNLLLGYTVSLCSRLFRLKTRWLYIAMNSSTLMRRHAAHPVRLFLLKTFWASYARIICLSLEQLEDFARLGIPRTHLEFVPFGVDISFFRPTDASREEELIVSVGRDAGRDYETLFKAAERTGHAFIVVAGRKNIPPDMPIPANVTVLYNRSLVEIRDLYARTRLVVVPSRDAGVPGGSDCSGQTVVLDALAAGKAVIATRRPWMTDYLVPGEDLVVIPPNDSHALARAIDSLWDDAGKRRRLAESGHRKVVERYTTQVFAQKLLALMHTRT